MYNEKDIFLAKFGICIALNSESDNLEVQRIDDPESYQGDLDFVPPLLEDDEQAKKIYELLSPQLSEIELRMNASKIKQVRDAQYVLQQEVIEKTGINIVTCGNCGSVVLHRLGETKIICPDCDFTDEPCHFPDLNC